MNTYLSEMDSVTGQVYGPLNKGKELNKEYQSAKPFPHTAIDNFLPQLIIDKIMSEFPKISTQDNINNRNQEMKKRCINPETLTPWIKNLFYSFNSRPFIEVVENITGIKGLIPDPYFLGGGLHEVNTGGYLSMHCDFNHHKQMNLERRVNVLIYLNPNWEDAFGGQLELWNDDMSKCVKSFVPLSNRCVIFNTTNKSNHGNPNPVYHPKNLPRRSIALYYYTATWDGSKRSNATDFKQRPGSSDEFDFKLKSLTLAYDWLPPIVYRQLTKIIK